MIQRDTINAKDIDFKEAILMERILKLLLVIWIFRVLWTSDAAQNIDMSKCINNLFRLQIYLYMSAAPDIDQMMYQVSSGYRNIEIQYSGFCRSGK